MTVLARCPRPRCPNAVTRDGLCSEHLAEQERYRPRQLQRKWADAVIARANGLCERNHGPTGREVVAATEAHHIRPLASFPPARRHEAWTMDNGLAVCGPCHRELSGWTNGRTRSRQKRYL